MIWSSSGIIFWCEFSCYGDCVIQRHHFSFYKIQDKVFKINVKIKIQDKKAHLRQFTLPHRSLCTPHGLCRVCVEFMQKPIVSDLKLKSHSDSCSTARNQTSSYQMRSCEPLDSVHH
jgi:hypothetical protein